jgi:geranylgeranyl transferase type-2 subunit beta
MNAAVPGSPPRVFDPNQRLSRRAVLSGAVGVAAGAAMGAFRILAASAPAPASEQLAKDTFAFIRRCARPDGGYAPSPDPAYLGNSDTSLSDLAAVTYAATLAKTMGWRLPNRKKSIEFVERRQQPDGSFVNVAGKMDPQSDLAVLYNTVQGVVALRALGGHPKNDPSKVMARFFVGEAFKKLPWYTTSFFPLFFAALGQPMPATYDRALRDWQITSQAEDGYLGDHVAATFHLAHYFRLIGQPTPKARQMVARVLRDQKADGGWNLKAPDWDVHACFDAVFILRQLGGGSAPVRQAIQKAADWALTCRTDDGGFSHYPHGHSDMDAVYFQFGTLIQAGRVAARRDLPDARTLSWGHALLPEKNQGR